MAIWTLIRENQEDGIPAFQVDYHKCVFREASPLMERVKSAIQFPFVCVSCFAIELASSVFYTVKNAPTSFHYIVLGFQDRFFASYYALPSNLYTIFLRCFYWGFSLGVNVMNTTLEGFAKRMQLNFSVLSQAQLGDELDIRHIRTSDSAIAIPSHSSAIQIRSLLTVLNQINFDNPASSGYMPPSSRQDGSITYTKQQLQDSLEKLINHVEQRIPFVGTPPAYDVEGVNRFYQQIEDVIRFCLHKTSTELAAFLQKHPHQASYTANEKREYGNLLENSAQAAITFAIAGQHCGARYMGEAMNLYFSWKPEAKELSLEEELIETLANKRLEIARSEAQLQASDTHIFARYIAQMGSCLAIPGSVNVTEHLSQQLNSQKLLTSFFKRYTVDEVIGTIQMHYKKSEAFREKVRSWLADQGEGWNKESTEARTKELTDLVNKEISKGDSLDATLKGVLIIAPELQGQSETAKRMIQGKIPVKGTIATILERERRSSFLQELLVPYSMTPGADENPIPSELIEWLLVKHQILLPQHPTKTEESVKSSHLSQSLKTNERARLIDSIVRIADSEDIDSSASNSKRYQLPSKTRGNVQKKVQDTFNKAFHLNPEAVIAHCETASQQRLYPLWKRVFYIQVPSAVNDLLTSRIVSWSGSAFICYKLYQFGQYCALDLIPTTFLCRVVPFVQATASPQMIMACEAISSVALKGLTWLVYYRFECLIGLFLLQLAIHYSPHIPYLTALSSRISLINFCCSLYTGGSSWNGFLDMAKLVFSVTDRLRSIGYFIDCKWIQPAMKSRLIECKENAYQVWVEANRQSVPM